MAYVHEGNSADEVWVHAAAALQQPETPMQDSRAGRTKELLHVMLTLCQPRQKWVVSRVPPLNPAFAIAEVLWILGGRNDSAFLNFWNHSLAKFAGDGSTYHGAYGHRLRRHFGIDQLDQAFKSLRDNPFTRQVVLQIWDPKCDLPVDGSPRSEDIPCNICACLKLRDGKLEWLQVMRSNDLFLGLPYNFVQWTSLQEVVAGWLGVEVGLYTHVVDSLHVYEHDLSSLATTHGSIAAENTDSLAVEKERFDTILCGVLAGVEALMAPALDRRELNELVPPDSWPIAYRNWFLILAAESARRRNWPETAELLASRCDNPSLRQTWANWLTRSGLSVPQASLAQEARTMAPEAVTQSEKP